MDTKRALSEVGKSGEDGGNGFEDGISSMYQWEHKCPHHSVISRVLLLANLFPFGFSPRT